MTTQRISSPIRLVSLLIGAGLVFIGGRFLLAPEAGETGFGLHYAQPNYAFHFIKGIRDVFSGLLIFSFAWQHLRRPLLVTLLAGSIIPVADMLIVWQTPDSNRWAMLIHGGTAITIWVLCYGLTRPSATVGQPTDQPTPPAGDLNSAEPATGKAQVLLFSVLPGEKTPWHYHTLFSESFTVRNGELVVGRNNQIVTLRTGQSITIYPGEKHFFDNRSTEVCLINVTVAPENRNFANSLLLFRGLVNDGLANKTGTPKRLSDLALFLWLNDSHMIGLQKIAEPLFTYLAHRAINRGQLARLMATYGYPDSVQPG